jgi:predicted ATPase/DNA-binding SARP family transcriptional activator
MEDLEFRVLGPFEVRRGDELLAAGGGRRRALLAVLLLSANRPVNTDRLIEQVWGNEPPMSATNLIQGYVSDWRHAFEPGRTRRSDGNRVASTGSGYLLRVQPHEADLLRFSGLAEQGRRAASVDDLDSARALLRDAVGERRGVALADFAGTPLDPVAAGLEEDWLAVIELAAEVELRLGSPQATLDYVTAPATDWPLRETLTALRMRALYQLGRQADALAAFDEARDVLADELGVDPAPRLRQLHLDILRQVPSLDLPITTPRRPTTLPRAISSFVGRAQDLTTVVEQISAHRLVTLTGPGGSGKTRLAVEAAARIAAAGAREVTFVDLAPVRNNQLLWPAIAKALGRPLPATTDRTDALARLFPPRPALLVLDNLEQLTGAAPGLTALLHKAPLVRILATSRQPLGVRGEQQLKVPPLAIPTKGQDRDRTAVVDSPSVRLFIDRARSCDPMFSVSDDDVPVIAGIARRLDGLPLTIELAAPWVTTLSLRALLERLDRPLSLLAESSPTDRPDRQRSLRAALDWSYAAMTPEQRRLLDHMSVFVSGARLEAVEAVTDSGEATLMRLAELVGKNLITRAGPADLPRYRLLETVREYAAEQLAFRPSEQRAVRDRHAAHFSAFAEMGARAARTPSADQTTRRLDEEQDEIRSALHHLAVADAADERLTLLVDCLPLWWDLGHVREGYDRLTGALRAAQTPPDELCASAHLAASVLADAMGCPDEALGLAMGGGHFARRAASEPLLALSRCLEGHIVSWEDWSGDAAQGIALLEDAMKLGELVPLGPTRWGWSSRAAVIATAAISLIDVLRYRDSARAHRILASVVAGRSGETDRHTESFLLRSAGALAADTGQWSRAEHLLHESLTTATSSASRRSESRSLEELARLARARRNYAAAAAFADDATNMAKDAGHANNWARCAALRADVALDEHDNRLAALLLDDAATAVGPGYPALADRTVHPRRARLARHQRDFALAEHHLAAASVLEHASGLTPDRVVYLVELALLALERGNPARALDLADLVDVAAHRAGLTLPLPEQERLHALRG